MIKFTTRFDYFSLQVLVTDQHKTLPIIQWLEKGSSSIDKNAAKEDIYHSYSPLAPSGLEPRSPAGQADVSTTLPLGMSLATST